MKIRFLGVAVIGLLLFAACGGDDDDTPATATAEPIATPTAEPTATEAPEPTATDALSAAESEYLDAVAELIVDFSEVVEQQEAALRQLWPTRERFFAGYDEYNVTAAILASAEAAQALTPPDRFASDHAALLAWFDSVQRWVPIRTEAIAEQDLLAFLVIAGELRAEFFVTLVHSDGVFCSAVTFGGTTDLCATPDSGLSDFGVAMRTINAEWNAQFRPRANFPPAMTDEETAIVLASRQIKIILAFENAIAAAENLTPPEEFADDHQRFMEFRAELLSLSREISVAAEEGEIIYFRDELIPRSGAITCSAFRDISRDYRQLTNAPIGC